MALESENGDVDVDLHNDETFGDGAVVDDWEAAHFSKVKGDLGERPLPLHHDDVILTATLTPTSGVEEDQVLPQLNQLKIKELWPSSPQQSSLLDSIWSSPELPVSRPRDTKKQPLPARGSPSLPPGSKALTLEELEHEYLSDSPSTEAASQSSSVSPHPPDHAHPPGIAPPPGIATANAGPTPFMGAPLPMGQAPPIGVPHPHPVMGWGIPPRFPLPPGFPVHRIPPPRVPIRHQPGPFPNPHHPRGPPHPYPHPGHYPPPSHRPPHHHHHHHMQNWPREVQEAPRKSRRSEYLGEMKADGSGFMTKKEKEWVIRIQLLQLQSPDPSNDDYYYQNYIRRKLLLEEQKRLEHQSHDTSYDKPRSSPAHSSSPSSSCDDSESSTLPQLLTLPQVERKERKYQPIEFKGTLGKVTTSSISAPRKTIDVPLSGGNGPGGEGAKDTYTKKKNTLAVIEKLYLHVLELESMQQKALALPEDDRIELLAKRDEICAEMFSLLKLKTPNLPWTKGDDSTFQLVMGFRKGKRVMKRVLPMFSDDLAHAVLLAMIRNLSSIIKKDSSDQVIPELIQSVSAVVGGLSLSLVVLSLSMFLSSISTSSSALVRVLQGEFGAELLLGLVRRGRKLVEATQQDLPNKDMEEWIAVTKSLTNELKPYEAILKRSNCKPLSALLSALASLSDT